jgi:hypothetical protein
VILRRGLILILFYASSAHAIKTPHESHGCIGKFVISKSFVNLIPITNWLKWRSDWKMVMLTGDLAASSTALTSAADIEQSIPRALTQFIVRLSINDIPFEIVRQNGEIRRVIVNANPQRLKMINRAVLQSVVDQYPGIIFKLEFAPGHEDQFPF